MGEFKAHAAEWKANVRAEFRETRRRMSVELHDKLQRAVTIRSMERRQLGLEQRAHSLDMLSPEKRAVFASLDAGRFKTSSQESIDTKLNNRRVRGAVEPYEERRRSSEQPQRASPSSSDDNLFNMRFGSLTKVSKRQRNRDLRQNVPEDVRLACEAMGGGGGGAGTALGEQKDEGQREGELEEEEEEERKEANVSLTDLPTCTADCVNLSGFVPAQAKERENEKILEGRNFQPQTSP